MIKRIVRHAELGIVAPGADSNILAASLAPSMTGSWFRGYLVPEGDTVLNYEVADDATPPVSRVITLNSGTSSGAVSAGAGVGNGISFDHPAPAVDSVSGDNLTYNYQIETDMAIAFLYVEEYQGLV